jgi:hypothetical protein
VEDHIIIRDPPVLANFCCPDGEKLAAANIAVLEKEAV